MSTTKARTSQVSVRSSAVIQSNRPRTAEATHQGMSARQNAASMVPTALAQREFQRSPWTRSAKLVVMPQDGQGKPVKR